MTEPDRPDLTKRFPVRPDVPVSESPTDFPGYPMPPGQQPPYGQVPYGQAQYGQPQPPPYSQPPPFSRPPPYPQPPAYPQPPYQQGFAQQGYGQQAYGQPAYGDPAAPFGRDPVTGEAYSDKSRLAAGLLQIFLGGFGAGRFYIGSNGIAIAQVVLLVLGWITTFILIGFVVLLGLGIWVLIDGIMMLTGGVRDSQGRPLKP